MKHLSLILVLLSVVALTGCGKKDVTAPKTANWQIAVADSASGVGQYTSLALDAQGNPHIAYHDYANTSLKYAFSTGGSFVNPASWTVETVDNPAGSVGRYASLALDALGNPRISYHDDSNGDLKYTEKNGTTWTTPEVVAFTGEVGLYTSLALDAAGTPHIAYYWADEADLKFVKKSQTPPVWETEKEPVDVTGSVGMYASLALDSQDSPRISYYDESNGNLKYAAKNNGTWTIETVDATGVTGLYTSLALDAAGNPHIGYYDQTNGDLKHAWKSGGTWTVEMVDVGGNVGMYASLALDAQGNPHISYYDVTNQNLRYAVKSGGAWSLATVDATGDVGAYSSLKLDAQGNPHISYNDATNGHLKFADWGMH